MNCMIECSICDNFVGIQYATEIGSCGIRTFARAVKPGVDTATMTIFSNDAHSMHRTVL